MPRLPLAVRKLGPMAWSKSAPELRDWVDANREALAMFRAASERPDGIALPDPGTDDGDEEMKLGLFVELIRLETSRLEELGDMAGAWSWYLAVFRMQTHVSAGGDRCFSARPPPDTASDCDPRVAAWAADRRTGAPLLRRALAERQGARAEARRRFVLAQSRLPRLHARARPARRLGTTGIRGRPPSRALVENDFRPTWHGPPTPRDVTSGMSPSEAGGFCDLRSPTGLPMSVIVSQAGRCRRLGRRFWSASIRDRRTSIRWQQMRRPLRVRLPPQDLAKWLVSTLDAKQLLFIWPWPSIRGVERREYRNLVVLLASELFERERGSPPPSEESLVGDYLDSLPSDDSEENDDGNAPTVRDTHGDN